MSSASPSPGLRQYAGTVSWLLVERVVKIVLGLTIGVAVTRYLGPRDFGYLSAALGVAAIATPFATLGFNSYLIREFSRPGDHARGLLGSAIVATLVASTTIYISIWLASWTMPLSDTLAVLLPVVGLAVIPAGWFVFSAFFQAVVDGRSVALPRLTGYVVGAAAKIAMVFAGAPLIWFAWAIVAESVVISAAYWLHYARSGRGNPLAGARLAKTRQIARAGIPFALMIAAEAAHLKVDIVMLQLLTTATETGQYAAASLISEAWYFVPGVIASTALPAIVSTRAEAGQQRTQLYFDLMTVFAVTTTIALAFVGPPLVLLLFGRAYAPAAEIFAIHVWSGILVTATVASQFWGVAEGLERRMMSYTLAAVASNVALNALLIPAFGGQGAAVSTLASYAVSGYLALALRADTRACLRMHARALLLHRAVQRLVAAARQQRSA